MRKQHTAMATEKVVGIIEGAKKIMCLFKIYSQNNWQNLADDLTCCQQEFSKYMRNQGRSGFLARKWNFKISNFLQNRGLE